MIDNEIQLIDIHPITRLVTFTLKPKRLSGIYKLIQVVILSLLNVPGKDVLDPDEGGGLPALIGTNFDPNDSDEAFGEIARRVRKSEQEIIDQQIGIEEDPEARLVSIQIINIENAENLDGIRSRLRIINEAGQASDVVV